MVVGSRDRRLLKQSRLNSVGNFGKADLNDQQDAEADALVAD
jgi:hypothetical protein